MKETEFLWLMTKSLTPFMTILIAVAIPVIKGLWETIKIISKLVLKIDTTNVQLEILNEKMLAHDNTLNELKGSVTENRVTLTEHETRIKTLENIKER